MVNEVRYSESKILPQILHLVGRNESVCPSNSLLASESNLNSQSSIVNAAQQATDIVLTSKIASAVSLFRSEFPDAKVDLKPWANDNDTQELVDPDSIDFSFHFPGWSRRWQSRSVLVQIRFYEDKVESTRSFIGLEVAGFDHRGKQWRLSTVNDWQFEGERQPQPEIAEKLKQFCRQMFELFSLGV